ncbi:diguanylate cyclase [Porphyrobacter sp. CACIAM 03H1]|uniref:sensor domain-containing diguanylate cyclase n=1 Tax=Porphyrobacter sp. CACIAM 03H1 TaxID=2003315 RepID=UPI000B5A5EA6|nr:diguanylate cyclase [Porphyrobacter sp. CACIAM 03H1]ASJ90023.1 GGDEF domain-containing protein [Porphyrobacter sp. CACIAM 03H1]
MAFVRLLFRLGLVAVVLALGVARPAAADDHVVPTFAPACHAAPGADAGVAALRAREAWICDNTRWRSDVPAAWLRFEAESWQGQKTPRYFFTRIARFDAITFHAVDADGTIRSRRLTEAEGTPFAAGPVFQLPLPEVTADTELLFAQVEGPHSIPLLTEARITHDPGKAEWSQIDMMLLAFVTGMLVLPLLFDISFFVVLRERFVVLHAAMVSAMMVYVLTAGGLASAFVTLPVTLMAVLAPLSWAVGAGISALFLVAFLERGAQSRLMRRVTVATGWFTMFVPGFFALQLDATQPFDDVAYFVTFLPAIAVISAAVIEAVLRGSRSARFIALAWLPIITASVERLLRGLGWHVGPSSLDQMLYVAVGIEVVVISLAIADRFLALRRERDAALTEARMLEQISTRDSLTGLMNRRAIEARFEELLAQGFDTFALVDLDRFKAINDLHGHQVGDAALVACASAIRASGDRDAVAVRLGGEEFVVLLRGPRPLERAEALRQAIPMRIAKEVPGLDLPVTASMGVVVMGDAGRHKMAFAEFYARADALMYEAKASGRNRLAYERLTVFNEPPAARARREEAA